MEASCRGGPLSQLNIRNARTSGTIAKGTPHPHCSSAGVSFGALQNCIASRLGEQESTVVAWVRASADETQGGECLIGTALPTSMLTRFLDEACPVNTADD